MAGINALWITGKTGRIIDHAEPGSSIFIAEYKDYMIGKDPMTGLSADLGIDYHINALVVPFVNLGYDTSRNLNIIEPVGPLAVSAFPALMHTIRITAGVYF